MKGRKSMAKIWKSARKMHKTANQKLKDGMTKFHIELGLGLWKAEETITKKEINKLLTKWKQAGNREKDFYRLGAIHLKQNGGNIWKQESFQDGAKAGHITRYTQMKVKQLLKE